MRDATALTVPSGKLTSIDGVRVGRFVDVGASALLGRSTDCAIRVDDPTVSRRHARITRDDQANFILQDLGSRNGTTVGGLPVTRCRLRDGDEIGIGAATFRFELAFASDPPDDESAPSPGSGPPGTMDRSRFDEQLILELTRAKRLGSDVWLYLLGVDPGDPARRERERGPILEQIATTVEGELHADDVLAYFGQTQFAILAKERKEEDPLLLAERIRRLVEGTTFVHDSQTTSLTVSVGVAALADCRHPSADQLLRLADAGFYAARIAGRNCCRRVADGHRAVFNA